MQATSASTGILSSVFAARIATLTSSDIARTFGSAFLVRLSVSKEPAPTALETDPVGARGKDARAGDVFIHPLKSTASSSVETITLGRIAGNHIQVCESGVSRVHARVIISPADGNHFIEDANSRNGTRVHGMRLLQGDRLLLANRDLIELGTVPLLFVDHTLIAELANEISSMSLRG